MIDPKKPIILPDQRKPTVPPSANDATNQAESPVKPVAGNKDKSAAMKAALAEVQAYIDAAHSRRSAKNRQKYRLAICELPAKSQ